MSKEQTRVLVKDSDMISAKSLLALLSDSIAGMKTQVKEKNELTEQNRLAIAGAVEALTDLHNLILSQINDTRQAEAFDASGDDHGGNFNA